MVEDPARRVRLVRQADLEVLRIARDARVGDARREGSVDRKADCRAEAGQAGVAEPPLDGGEKVGDQRLWRIHPVGNQIDLPAVQPLGDDLGVHSAQRQRSNGRRRGPVERRVLVAGRVTPVQEVKVLRGGAEDLRSAVHEEMEAARSVRTGTQLTVDVPHVGPGDDGEVEAKRAQFLDELAQDTRVGLAVRNSRAVPVENDRLETAVERRVGRAPDHLAGTTTRTNGGAHLDGSSSSALSECTIAAAVHHGISAGRVLGEENY